MSFKKYLTGFVMALSVVLSAASLFAADIVGLDTTAGANWRTAANFDSSGGTEYGSDGYIVYGLNQIDGQYDGSYTVADGATHDQSHLPAYITGITRATTGMWSGNGNFGQMQDPDNANALTSVPLLANGAEPQTYTIQRTAGTAFRLTVLVASGDGGNVTHVTTCQDSVDQETQSTNHAANGLHYHVYDVEAGSGDVTVTVNDLNAAYHITGLAFDPPPTVPGALTLSSATVTNITSTNALGGVVLGGTNAYVTLYWGTNNAAKTFTWEATNSTLASSLQATGTLGNVVISNLVADSQYFYIFYASNNVGGLTNWSAINQSFDSGLTGKSVTNLSAAAANPTKIDLTWTDNFNTETGYVIQRSPDGSSWVALTTTASNESSYADSSVSWTNTYHYRIAATNAAGLSAWSTTAQATTPARTNRIDTDFTEATFDDIGILRDIPNSGLASITLDDPNDRLVVATTGGTDMWGSRNNAPIGYILKPTGPLWFMETEIEYATADSGKVFGLTVYSDSDGAKPDFTFGLDRWAGGTGLIKLQGLGDNNPNISVIASNATRVVLRVEAEDDGGGPGFARYTLKYDLLLGGGMRTLTTYDSNFSNARVGLVMKTNAGKTGYVHNLEIDTLIQPVLTNPAVTNITATTALGGVALSGGSAYLTLYWGGSDEGASFTWDETNALPLEQTTGTVNGVAISNLVADTQYFYIFYASNSVSGLTNWSDLSQSFGSALTGKSVTNLSAIASIGQVDLSWTDNFNSETGYVIQRSPDGSSWAALTTVAAGSSGYSDVNVLPLSTYHYRIAATNASGLSDWSTAAQATLPYPPSDNCRITFTNFAGRGTLTNFPALVKLSTNITDFAYDGFLSTNGYDLRFWTNAALTGTEVNYEIEQWSTGDTSHVWVQVPRLTQNSSIWASWGNPAYNSQATYTTDGSVWNTEYQGVWHMNDGTGETVAQDATASNETATLQNMESGTDWVPGNIAGALDFDGANEYLSTALMVAQANSSPPSVTFSAWAYPHTANGNYESVFGTDNGGWDWELGLHSSLKWEIFNGNGQVISTHNATLNDWQHIAAVFDKAAGNVKVYVNGVEQVIAGIGYEAHNPLRIGGMGYGYFDGLIDEARVSHIDRSEDWIWACWMNQGGNHSAFVDYGTVAQADTNLPTLASATVTNITTTNALGGVVLGTTDAYITLYWGESDEGNAFTWALTNSSLASSLQSTGTLSNVAISNLVVDTRYYYVFYASNSVGTVWTAADQSFNSALTGKSVTDLVATAASIPEIDLTWTDNFNTETGYVIQRSPDGSSWAALTTTAADVSSYTDTGLSELSTNHYRIAATNGTGLSDWSSTDVATTPARPNQIDTDFTEADFNDIGIMRDIPNAGLASITLDDTNDRLVFATTGGTDMWGSRNNAPIGYILKPTGPLWFMEAEIEYETADNGKVFGLTVYSDSDGAKPDFTYGLDRWAGGAGLIKLQGLGDNNPNISVIASNATRVVLRVEAEDDGGGPGFARYTLKYDLLLGDGMQTLTTYDSNFSNARVGLVMKTSAGKTGYVHNLEIDSVPPGQPVLSADTVTNITATTALGGVTLAGANADLTLFWGESDEGTAFMWDQTNTLPAEQAVGTINGVAVSNLVADTQYFYIFYASNTVSGLTNWSDLNQSFDSALTGKSVTNLSASAPSSGQIDLSWTDNFNTETGYVIQRSPDGSSWAGLATTAAGASSYADSSVSPANTYHYRIAATNASWLSDWSTSAQATTPALPSGIIVADLIEDLDAENGVTLGAGTDVTAWANQAAGGGDDVAASVGSPQLLAEDTIGGKDAVEFTSDRMIGDDNSAFDVLLSGSGFTWFIVAKVPDQIGGGGNRFFGTLQNFNPWDGIMAGVTGAEQPYNAVRSGSDVTITAVTNLNDGNYHIIAGRLAAGTGSVLQEVFVDEATAAASGNVTVDGVDDCDGLSVGSERTGGAEYIDASIARILIYDRPLSDVEMSHNMSKLDRLYMIPRGALFLLR